MNKMILLIFTFLFLLSLPACDSFEKAYEMGKESLEKTDLITQKIEQEIGSKPHISWRIDNGKSTVLVHFQNVLDDKMSVHEFKTKVSDIVKKDIGFKIDTFLISINGNL